MAASIPPKVQWMEESSDGTQMNIASIWDAGIVQAGDESDPKEFYIWNNRGGTSDVADMINTKISVRDATGGYSDGDITKQERATVLCQMWDQSKSGGEGQWGSFTTQGTWNAGTFVDLMWNNARDLIAADGATKGTVSGKANNGLWVDDPTLAGEAGKAARANFVKVKLVLRAKSDADAGAVQWRTRCSYQFV